MSEELEYLCPDCDEPLKVDPLHPHAKHTHEGKNWPILACKVHGFFGATDDGVLIPGVQFPDTI